MAHWCFVPVKVREIVESLQVQLQESEPVVADLQDIIHGYTTSSWFDQHFATLEFRTTQLHIHLQEKADSLEEKRVLLERKVARAERDRDIATVSEETPKTASANEDSSKLALGVENWGDGNGLIP